MVKLKKMGSGEFYIQNNRCDKIEGASASVYLVKYGTTSAYISLGSTRICVPKELIGKRIRFKAEFL